MSDVMLNYPIAPISGNHESQTDSFISHFNICPASGSDTSTGAYYSFDYCNAHFVMLNTNENSTAYSDFSVDQVEWMQADISAAKAEEQWIIVLLHKGPYTTSNHATDSDIMGATGVRTLSAPIFAELGVDLVLQGHDHIYARSKPVSADGTADVPAVITEVYNGETVDYQVNPDGSIYLIPSTAGPKVYYKNQSASLTDAGYYDLFDVADESHSAVYGSDPSDSSRPVRSMVDNFESITIDGDRLTVVSYEIDHGTLIDGTDSEVPYVIDTFGILKDSAGPVIDVEGIVDGDTVTLNQAVTVNWSADDPSGIASASATVANGGLLDTSACGEHTLTFTATDCAGNTTIKSITYYVAYRFSGFLQPADSGKASFKAGSTIPVKFRLADANGEAQGNAEATLYVARQQSDGTFGAETAAAAFGSKNGETFRYSGDQYIYKFSTKSLGAGTYRLRIDLGDGVVHTMLLTLR
jgi:3',5'-cyclic AMP phosphodiesterase CpdA